MARKQANTYKGRETGKHTGSQACRQSDIQESKENRQRRGIRRQTETDRQEGRHACTDGDMKESTEADIQTGSQVGVVTI